MNIAKLFKTLTKKQKATLLKLAMNDNQEEVAIISTCPHCKSESIFKFGKKDGHQRYKCKSCNKTFSTQTKSLFQDSNKDISTWKEYIKLMFAGLSLRNISAQMDISLPTAFYWRHKVLKSLSTIKTPKLKGFVEADETFFRLSYKGQRKLPRKAKKRGFAFGPGINKRDWVCVACALDRNKNFFNKSTCLGKVNMRALRKTLKNVISKNALLITDGEHSYKKFAEKEKITLKQVAGKSSHRIYNIQRMNNYHSNLKQWMGRFKGVATKHLDNYLVFFKIMKTIKSGVFEEISKLNEVTRYSDITSKKMNLV